MNRPDSPFREKEMLNRLKANNRLAFSELYDRYASALLGLITRIVSNEAEAMEILEKSFIEIRSQADQFQPEKQPLFVWLFSITRRVALDELKKRKPAQTLPLPLRITGQLIATAPTISQPAGLANPPTNARLSELIDAVVFKNCTPEEAAASLGIPSELARQHLRLAMQQVQVSRKP